MGNHIDVRSAICAGDAGALRRVLSDDPSRANDLIRWGANDCILTHPLHYVSDMLFNGVLQKGTELSLIDAVIEAGADLDFQRGGQGDTPLIGAASLGAEDVGLRLLEAGADPDLRGRGGETALHWAALLGEDRLVAALIKVVADLDLKDAEYHASPLGWAVHGWCDPPAGNCGHQREAAALLVAAGAHVEPQWLESDKPRGRDPGLLAALRGCVE